MILGAHCSTAGGFYRAIQRGQACGCAAVQIFVKNNMQWLGKAPATPDIDRFAQEWKGSGIGPVFGHTGYLINLGAGPSPNRDKSLESLIQELEFADRLRLPFLVLHPGAHLGAGQEVGLARIVEGLDEVFCATRKSGVRIALENTAGQGSCLGDRFEHLVAILDRVKNPERLGVCLDTAHLLAAGHEIRTPESWERVIRQISDLIGLPRVLAFHLNDSKTPLGSRVDRHAHIGQGHIGLKGFRHIVNDPRFAQHPGCLETPKSDDLHEDVENLERLRYLAGSRPARGIRVTTSKAVKSKPARRAPVRAATGV